MSAVPTHIQPDPASVSGSETPATWTGRIGSSLRGIARERVLLVVVAGSFLIRLLLAGWNSYWLDELYSVAFYGVWNVDLVAAIRNLAETSVHPPLYQSILYLWMDLFGDGEVVTRTLSNLYVTASVLVLFVTVRRGAGRRVALASAVVYSVMSTTMLFGLETRSYAQTMLLATVSSYFLVRLVTDDAPLGPRRLLASWPAVGLMAANFGLLYTHYYNGFFIVAQGVYLAGVLVATQRVRQWTASVPSAAVIYLVPAAVFWLTWGGILVESFRRTSGAWEIEESGNLLGPLDLLLDSILTGNVASSRTVAYLWVVGAVVLTVAAVRRLATRPSVDARRRAWTDLYWAVWVFLPLVVVTVVFQAVGVARFNSRYFVFSVPAVAPLTVLMACSLGRFVASATKRWSNAAAQGVVMATVAGAVLAALVLPGTFDAGNARKPDWRGTAQEIVAIVHSNPDADYVVLEPSFRRQGVFDFYLERYSSDVRVRNTIRRHEEAKGGPFVFDRQPQILTDHDFLIVPFIHHRTSDFPIAVERLESLATVHLARIDRSGRGMVIYDLDSPN